MQKTQTPANGPQTAATSPEKETNDVGELMKAMGVAAVIAVLIRTFLFEPFNIPSSSMYPNLLIGDYLFVEKYSYGYSKYSFPFGLGGFEGRISEDVPKRGDVAVFRLPSNPRIDYIKRIIGLPGDTIQVREGALYINNLPVPREFIGAEDVAEEGRIDVFSRYMESLPEGPTHAIYELSDAEMLDDTPVYTVPEGYYFAMGDNRDKSQDSRVMDVVGFVPAENLIGRAAFIFFSIEPPTESCKSEGMLAGVKYLACAVVKWPMSIRYSRLFKSVNGE